VVVEFIDAYKARFGVVPICRVLSEHHCGIAPSSYYAYRSRPPSARALSDRVLLSEVVRVQRDQRIGRGRYGARKVWLELRREGITVARCTVERLMRDAVLAGVRRGAARVRRVAISRRCARPTSSIGSFARTRQISCGSLTSRTPRRGSRRPTRRS
jgi:HTH-like domain